MKFLKIILSFSLFCNVYSMERLSDPLSNSLHRDVLQRVVVHYIMNIPFLKEKYTEDDLLDFATQTNNYLSIAPGNSTLLNNIVTCTRVCKLWNTFVHDGAENFASLHTNLYINTILQPTSVLAYIKAHNLCDLNSTKEVHFSRISSKHRNIIEKIINQDKTTIHLLSGIDIYNPKDGTKTTMIHCVMLPENNMNTTKARISVNIATYYLFTGKGEALLRETNRNENGNFTFKGFFSFLKYLTEDARNESKNEISAFAFAADIFINKQNVILCELEESIASIHHQGRYPESILISSSKEEYNNEKGSSIRGISIESGEGEATEIVKVIIPFHTIPLYFFDAVLRSKFIKSDGRTLTVYFGKDEVLTQSVE